MRWFPTAGFVSAGLLFMIIAVPLMRRRVPPNGMYGVRIPATLADEHVWYEVNARSGGDLLVLGAVVVVLAFAVLVLGWPVQRQVPVMITALLGGTILLVVRALRHANRLRRDR